MIRTICVPESNRFLFILPDEYVGKRLEITIMQENEIAVNYAVPEAKRVKFNAVSLDTRNFKFDREEANAKH
ncbi:MAG: hypothetical protein FWF53_10910 [Candidatus Azobacteroides sp.]|nr:hypothetical protein [Candidatus Azobacteroides sp.]